MDTSSIDVLLVEGPASSGKTQCLAARAQEAADKGQSVAVIAASAGGAHRLRAHLADACTQANVTVTSAKALVAQLLACDELTDQMGYAARLMTPAEDKVFFEDLKTGGIKPSRLRQMTSFFERTYSDLGEQADDFPYEWEETGMLEYEAGYLEAYGVTTLERASCALCRLLESNSAFAQRIGYDCVVVDDYQLLGRAMQLSCCLLAKGSLTVANDHSQTCPAEFRFPYGAGAKELAQRYEGLETQQLAASHASKQVCTVLNALRADEGMALGAIEPAADSAQGSGGRIGCAVPAAEFDQVCTLLKRAHEDGIPYGDMAVSSASEVWLANAASYLQRVGIPLAFVPGANAPNISFKDDARNDAARLACMIALLADPNDNMAWRTWCGFGSYTANSAVFMRIRRAALEDGLGIVQVIRNVRDGAYPDIAKIADTQNVLQALDEAEFAFERLAGLRGRDLLCQAAKLSQVADGKPAAQVERLIACGSGGHGLAGDEDAAALAAILKRAFIQPDPSAQDAVLCAMPQDLAGFKLSTVVFCGAVNGILPLAKYFDASQLEDDKRQRMRRKDDARLYLALSRACKRLYVTSFEDIGLEQAERLGLEVHRIRAQDGRRIARVLPSVMTQGIPNAAKAGDLG